MFNEQLYVYVKSLSPEEFSSQIKNGTFAENYIEKFANFTFVKVR